MLNFGSEKEVSFSSDSEQDSNESESNDNSLENSKE